MDKIILKAQERDVLGKKVKNLRRDGLIPGHVFGNKIDTEHVSVIRKDFLKVLNQAGETSLVDLRIGEEKIRPVLIRDVQFDPVSGNLLNIDFYQVNLKVKVTVPVPIVLVGEETELVHLGEAVVLQTLSEVQVESLPTDLIEKIEVDISILKNIDDDIKVSQLNYNREVLTVLAEGEEVVVKLAPAVTEEMKALLEEQEAEAAAAKEAAVEEAGEAGETPEEGEEGETAEGETAEGDAPADPDSIGADQSEEKSDKSE